jgi:hypothetical protein
MREGIAVTLHYALHGERLRLEPDQGLKPAGFGAPQRGRPLRKRNLDHFTVVRNPDFVDQTEFDGIVGILDGDPHYAVADSERYRRKHPAVVVVYAKHLTTLCTWQRKYGSASRTSGVPIYRH